MSMFDEYELYQWIGKRVARETLPKSRNGVDWGKDSIVLLKHNGRAIVWSPGTCCRDGMGHYTYYPGSVMGEVLGEGYSSCKTIYDARKGERISYKMLKPHYKAIAAFLFPDAEGDDADRAWSYIKRMLCVQFKIQNTIIIEEVPSGRRRS